VASHNGRVSTTASIRFTVSPAPAPARKSADERARLLAAPGFGRIFSEHMVSIHWDAEDGWHDAALRPYGPVQLDPATSYLHYAQGVFEGLKAFRQANGGVAVFRPEAHAARFRRSSRRLALPELLALVLAYWLLYPLAFASWLIIVFSGRLDRTIWGFSEAILRWVAAILSYVTLLRDEYPGSGRHFPQRFEIAYPSRRSRVRALFRLILILPQLCVVELLILPLAVGAAISTARLDGASEFEIYWRMAIPLSTPVLGALLVLASVSQ